MERNGIGRWCAFYTSQLLEWIPPIYGRVYIRFVANTCAKPPCSCFADKNGSKDPKHPAAPLYQVTQNAAKGELNIKQTGSSAGTSVLRSAEYVSSEQLHEGNRWICTATRQSSPNPRWEIGSSKPAVWIIGDGNPFQSELMERCRSLHNDVRRKPGAELPKVRYLYTPATIKTTL